MATPPRFYLQTIFAPTTSLATDPRASEAALIFDDELMISSLGDSFPPSGICRTWQKEASILGGSSPCKIADLFFDAIGILFHWGMQLAEMQNRFAGRLQIIEWLRVTACDIFFSLCAVCSRAHACMYACLCNRLTAIGLMPLPELDSMSLRPAGRQLSSVSRACSWSPQLYVYVRVQQSTVSTPLSV